MADVKYCLCCGEDVPYNSVERHERKELTCAYCGFTLDVQKLWERAKVSEGYALVADDSRYVRKIIIEALTAANYCSDIREAENGIELINQFTRLSEEGRKVEVAIIDLNMPVMDGITAARTLRAIETQKQMPPAPIVFFSAVKADEALRNQMDLLSPATYMNKGSDPDPESLAKRVEELMGYLAEKYKNEK